MKSLRLVISLAAIMLILLSVPGAFAQDDDTLRIEIVRGNLRIPIAIPYLEAGSAFAEAARQIPEIIREDLRREEIFNLADDVVYSGVGRHGQDSVNDIPFDRYADFKIDAVLVGRIVPVGERMRVEVRLFSVRDRSTLFGKGFTGNTDNVRQFAHRISANILYHFTGSFGVFDSKLYFTSTRGLGDGTQNSEIWVMDYDGHNAFRITYSNSLKLFPHIGPGNSGLAYTSFINANADVYLLQPGREDAKVLFSTEAGDMTPAISPDGTKVVFSSSHIRGNMDIFVVNIDGTGLRRLTDHYNIDTNPCWSPDGRKIAFSSQRTGSVQIYTMNADGSNQQRITFEGRYNEGADWSPDGRYIAYGARRSGSKTFDIRIHDLTTNQTYYVTRDVENDESPSFSPDGRSIAFTSDRSGGIYQIWTVDIDGRNMRQLTFDGENKHPSWTR